MNRKKGTGNGEGSLSESTARTALEVICKKILTGQDIDQRPGGYSRNELYHNAIENDNWILFQTYLKLGFDPNARELLFQRTPLSTAIQHSDHRYIKALIEAGVSLDNRNYLHEAILVGDKSVVKILVDHGVGLPSEELSKQYLKSPKDKEIWSFSRELVHNRVTASNSVER